MDGKLKSHLEWPNAGVYMFQIMTHITLDDYYLLQSSISPSREVFWHSSTLLTNFNLCILWLCFGNSSVR